MVLSSMTGFGRANGRLSERLGMSVVVRSVNHKYLDIQVRTNLREEVPEVEAVVRAVIEERFQRGRVTVQINFEHGPGTGARVALDTEQMSAVIDQMARVRLPDGVTASLDLGDVLAVPGLVTVSASETVLDDSEADALRSILAEAVEDASAMRREEGGRILLHVESELASVRDFLDWFEPRTAGFREALMARAVDRIGALLDSEVESDRVAQEAALLADRADVAEEVVRLRAHLASFSDRLQAGGAVGRTLDFLCQEMHRELNTLGAKCRELGVADRLVDAKAAAERVREQVQNLE
jgi:uncharacterized protein (TIGR00255 family)